MVDHVVREARRSEREGLVAGTDGSGRAGRAGGVLGGRWPRTRSAGSAWTSTGGGPVRVRASGADLVALLDALMDNVFTHTDEGVAVRVSLAPRPDGGLLLVVEDDGPGYPDGLDVTRRGTSGAGSTGPRDVDRRGDGRRVRRPSRAGTHDNGRRPRRSDAGAARLEAR